MTARVVLPLVEPHRRDHTYCAYCPKLCRHSCPVSTVQARETTTPWGKMTSLHHVAEGNLEPAVDIGTSWYACTGCMRCRSFCDHGNDVAAALAAGRAEAMSAGFAPDEATSIVKNHARRVQRSKNRAQEIFPDRSDTTAPIVYVPGCTAVVLDPDEASAGERVVRTLTGKAVRVSTEGCCGLPLLEAGDQAGFVQAATRFLRTLDGAEQVVFLDPGCLHAMTTTATRLDVRSTAPALHLTSLAAAHRTRLQRVEVDEPVAYHDPCRLGRGLGIYDEPRAVLEVILGTAPIELTQSRDRAFCSGGGGQLPRIDRGSSVDIARELLSDPALPNASLIASACPGQHHALHRAGARTTSLARLIAQALPAS